MNSVRSSAPQPSAFDAPAAARSFASLGQQILSLIEAAGVRAESRRQLASATRRTLDDCGLTFADVDAEMTDMFANDFRVRHIAMARAA